jgi:hypothetical protein
LLDAIVGVNGPGLPPNIAVGGLFYPNREVTVTKTSQDVTACVNTSAAIPIDRLGDQNGAQRSLLRSSIERVQLATSTPTDDAYRYALQNGILATDKPGNKFMLLITDGTPTLSPGCMNPAGRLTGVDPTPIGMDIANAYSQYGVRTFLIGSPGSEENREWMSTAAFYGGTANPGCQVDGPSWCHMDMTSAPDFSAALRAGLARVIGALTPCNYSFPDPPDGEELDSSKINVIFRSSTGQNQLIVRDDIGDCTEGWQLTSDHQIQLCPNTCSDVQVDAGGALDVVFGCASLMEPLR